MPDFRCSVSPRTRASWHVHGSASKPRQGAPAYRGIAASAQVAPAGNGRSPPPMSIVPETVGKGNIGINLNALGTVTSLATVTIRTQISGYLMKIDFKEGEEVKKGDLLAEIDPRPYEAALAQANGNLTRDQALLKGAQVDL